MKITKRIVDAAEVRDMSQGLTMDLRKAALKEAMRSGAFLGLVFAGVALSIVGAEDIGVAAFSVFVAVVSTIISRLSIIYTSNVDKHVELSKRLGDSYIEEVNALIEERGLADLLRSNWFRDRHLLMEREPR